MFKIMLIHKTIPARLLTKPHLVMQLALLIILKIIILMVIWYALIRGYKVQGDAPATAEYFLTDSIPKLQLNPQSSWK